MSPAANPAADPQARKSLRGVRPVRRQQAVNLARRPFANTRYIRRLGVALWILGALLLALDGYLYWQSLFGIEGKKEERAELEQSIAAERERIAEAERQLASIDLERQNVEATYLNERIAQRTFPWSALFDQLAEVLPRRVRLYSLSPQTGSGARAASRTARASAAPPRTAQRVHLRLTGVAESDEALLELIDNLFAHPAFDAPSLPGEARQPDGVQFTLNVYYLPGRRAERVIGGAAAAEIVEDGPAAPGAEGAP